MTRDLAETLEYLRYKDYLNFAMQNKRIVSNSATHSGHFKSIVKTLSTYLETEENR